VDVCFLGARGIYGKSYTVEDCFEEILKDKVFYRNTGGGVTLSGGEPTLYPDFLIRLFELCKEEGIHTAIETCGYTSWKSFEKIAGSIDLFLYDIKVIDPEKHRVWTGVDNRLILRNAQKLARMGKKMIVRVPLVPGVNDGEEEFRRIAEFAKSLETVKTMHLLPFHHIGQSKYETLDMEYAVSDLAEPNQGTIRKCRRIAEEVGLRVNIGGSGFVSESPETDETPRESFFIYPD
jgi:pyruvate formate lyase activating enzyme